MERFSNFLNSYTKSVNKTYNSKGALFMDYQKRIRVESESDFISFVFHIHKNAVHHGMVKKSETESMMHTSRLSVISLTRLLRNEVLNWFGGRK